MTTGRLTQHDLRNLAFTCHLNKRSGNVVALHTYHLSAEVFSQHDVFFQSFAGSFSLLLGIATVFEYANKLARECKIALRLNGDGNQVSVQSMCQPPRIA